MFALPGFKDTNSKRKSRQNSSSGTEVGSKSRINVQMITPEDVERAREEAKEWSQQVNLHRQKNGAERSTLESKAKCYQNAQLNKGREADIMVNRVREADTRLQEKLIGLQPSYEDQNQRVELAGHKAQTKCQSLQEKYAARARAVR